ESTLQERALIIGHSGSEVVRTRGWRRNRSRKLYRSSCGLFVGYDCSVSLERLRRRRSPRRMKRVELERIYGAFRIFPSIHSSFDYIPEFTNISGPVIGLKLSN